MRPRSEPRLVPAIVNLSEVRGQEKAKRAMEIAAAGGHHIVLSGPCGCGKTMLADAFVGLLPPASNPLSVGGCSASGGQVDKPAAGRRVARSSPNCSRPSLLSDLALAHDGLLVLDDAERFAESSLSLVREALDRGEIRPGRGQARLTRFQLFATVRCCPCGMGYETSSVCGDGDQCQTEHQWPAMRWFLDVVDLQVAMEPVRAADWSGPIPEASMLSQRRIVEARERQARRGQMNAELSGRALNEALSLPQEADDLLDSAILAHELSGRDRTAILRIARTLADLEGVDDLRRIHVAEALIYRFYRPRYDGSTCGV